MIKKILPYIISVLLGVGLFIAGAYVGMTTIMGLKSSTMMQDSYLKYSASMHALHYLAEGENEKARDMLLLEVDTSIIEINNLSHYADEDSNITACKVMKHMHEKRGENPSFYSSRSPEFDLEINKVLAQWKDCISN